MFNDFKDGDKVWVNNKEAIIVGTKPSLFGKDYLIGYMDGSLQEPLLVQGYSVLSLEKAKEMGLVKTVQEQQQEKPKKDLGNFVEGVYLADEVALLMNGQFTIMKFDGIENNADFKKLDEMMQLAVGMLSKTGYKFEDGKYSAKAIMGGYGLWRDYEVKGDTLTLPDQKGTITLNLKDGKLQQKSVDGTGQEIFITYVRTAKS